MNYKKRDYLDSKAAYDRAVQRAGILGVSIPPLRGTGRYKTVGFRTLDKAAEKLNVACQKLTPKYGL